MSLTRAQQILLKRAQAEAGVDDAEYRDSLELLSALPGCRSSKDPRLTDRHLDHFLGYLEAIYWQSDNSGAMQPIGKRSAVFRQRGYWQSKNRAGSTSRDRFMELRLAVQIQNMEDRLITQGVDQDYLAGIFRRSGGGMNYLAALRRTLAVRQVSA